MKKYKAIIFDFDGTLVNTEEICAQLHPIIFKKYGYNLSKEQALLLRSAGYPLRENLINEWFHPKNPAKLVVKVEKKLHKYFKKWKKVMPVTLKENCIKIMQYLCRKEIPIVVATSSSKYVVEDRMVELNIRQYFTEIYSAENLRFGKPEPDIYEYVCFKLNLKPEECLAIEDCPNGVISACRAGCNTVMIPDLTKPDKDLINNYKFKIIKNLSELKKIVK